jgi:hypothetical protein
MTKQELVELIKENFMVEDEYTGLPKIDLSGIDWGNVVLDLSNQKVMYLTQRDQEVLCVLEQSYQKVGDLRQHSQVVQYDVVQNDQKIGYELNQIDQHVGDLLDQSGQFVGSYLNQKRQNVRGGYLVNDRKRAYIDDKFEEINIVEVEL